MDIGHEQFLCKLRVYYVVYILLVSLEMPFIDCLGFVLIQLIILEGKLNASWLLMFLCIPTSAIFAKSLVKLPFLFLYSLEFWDFCLISTVKSDSN